MEPASPDGEQVEVPRGAARRKTGRKDDDIYCHCRQPEGGRFMIGCDKCDEWYHGDCVQITRHKGKGIDRWFCPYCQSKYPELKTIYFVKKSAYAEPEEYPQRCTDCINCARTPDCGECDRCKAKDGRCVTVICLIETSTSTTTTTPVVKKEKQVRKPIKKKQSDDELEDEAFSPTPARKAGGGGIALSDKKPRGRKKGWRKDKMDKNSPIKSGAATARASGTTVEQQQLLLLQAAAASVAAAGPGTSSNRPGYNTKLVDRLDAGSQVYAQWTSGRNSKARVPKHEPMQCLGIECTREARHESKYCSDECGMKLAKTRLNAFLPKGIADYWRVEPVAERYAREEEARKRIEMESLQEEKTKLDAWDKFMRGFIEALKKFKADETEDDRKDDSEIMVACSVCTVEYGSKQVARHIERCYAKAEKQITYGNPVKCAVNPHNLFCDVFNRSNQTYCKRLRVICPEHYKGEDEEGLAVCGCPRSWLREGSQTIEEMFEDREEIISRGVCCIPKKDCKQHGNWITLILGSIDARRLAVMTRLETLFESRQAAQAVVRGDALTLMTNRTVHHQPVEQLIATYNREQERAGETVMSTVLL